MRRPVEDQQTAPSDNLAGLVEGEPAQVFTGLELLADPGLEMLRHDIEDAIIRAAGIHEHAPAVVSDDGGVGGCGGASGRHALEYMPQFVIEDVTCMWAEVFAVSAAKHLRAASRRRGNP